MIETNNSIEIPILKNDKEKHLRHRTTILSHRTDSAENQYNKKEYDNINESLSNSNINEDSSTDELTEIRKQIAQLRQELSQTLGR